MPTIPDVAEDRASQVKLEIAQRVAKAPASLADWFEQLSSDRPGAAALLFGGREWTYAELDAAANRVAHAARDAGVEEGGTVAVLLENSPEMVAVLIGLAKIGASSALMSPETRGLGLAHALAMLAPHMVIAESRCSAALGSCGVGLPQVRYRDAGGGGLAAWLEAFPSARPPAHHRAGTGPASTAFYILTSGTSGLPKAARCSHGRYLASAISEAVLLGIEAEDRVYVVLPLYHIAALSAVGAALSVGGSALLRERFSASRFWEDVREHGVTALQYLGEIARYVAAQPPRADDRHHTLRAMIGAGMQESVWRAFRDRFGVNRIVECYGSSEGVCNLVNLDGVVGSVGRPPVGDTSMRLIRLDDAQAPLRRADGCFIDCAIGEPGELIGLLDQPQSFEGYAADEATRARIFVERAGDQHAWFRSGDIFQRDAAGYFYFLDRVGDNFRWKGENISTQEVAAAIGTLPDVRRAVVYGVRVPGAEGRAGMALIEVAPGCSLDHARLAEQLRGRLPAAAMPLFVRDDVIRDLTDTYKVRVSELRRQGYDPTQISGRLFVLDSSSKAYVPLTADSLSRNGLSAFVADEN